MSLTTLQKIQFIGLLSQKEKFLSVIQSLSLVHLRSLVESRDTPVLNSGTLSDTEECIQYLTSLSPQTPSGSLFSSGKIVLDSPLDTSSAALLVTDSHHLREELVRIENDILKHKEFQSSLVDFIDYPSVDLNASDTVLFQLYKTQIRDITLLPLMDIMWSKIGTRESLFLIGYHQSLTSHITSFESKNKLEKVTLPAILETSFVEALQKSKKQQAALEEQRQTLETKLQSITKHIPAIKQYYDELLTEAQKHRAASGALSLKRVFVMEGYIPEQYYPELESGLKKQFGDTLSVERVTPEENEKVPTLSDSYADSYSVVTDMYGSPSMQDIDPTPSMAPFFFLSFGLCLSDVGYGVILLLMGAVMWSKGVFDKEELKIWKLVTYCGIAAVLGGVVLGGWFGITPAQAPSFLLAPGCDTTNIDNCMFVGQLLNPMRNPLLFLIVALVVGIVQLMVGVVMNGVRSIKHGDYGSAVFDSGSWLFFLLMACGLAGGESLGLSLSFEKLTGLAAIILILTQGRHEKNWLMKPLKGLLGLYNSLNYLSDTLSYARIMALGLATGVVAFAMNLTAGVIGDMVGVPGVKHVVMAFVLVFGHALNFGLSLLGAFIHTARLQFVEYFGQFYTGGGEKFTPFRKKSKYTLIRSADSL